MRRRFRPTLSGAALEPRRLCAVESGDSLILGIPRLAGQAADGIALLLADGPDCTPPPAGVGLPDSDELVPADAGRDGGPTPFGAIPYEETVNDGSPPTYVPAGPM